VIANDSDNDIDVIHRLKSHDIFVKDDIVAPDVYHFLCNVHIQSRIERLERGELHVPRTFC
jgi:hypothetical protein